MRAEVVDIIDGLENERSTVGQLYNEAYRSDTTFTAQEIKTDVVNNLTEQ
jgi:hypothetical protein